MSLNIIFLLAFLTQSTHAHEMWIEPQEFAIQSGEGILANEVVGQNFKGDKYAYVDDSFDSLNITVADKTKRINSRLGDLPAIQEKPSEEGLHIITAETSALTLSYENLEKFTDFLNAEGLQWVLAEHKKRDLPESGFKEVYRRNAKSLIKVGHGKGQDKALGMPFEWVLETNPYTDKGVIKAQLLWQGKPALDMHVNIFNKPKHDSLNSELIKTSLRTDVEGRIEIPRGKGGLFLISSVKMIESKEDVANKTGAVWESIWASLSYKILN